MDKVNHSSPQAMPLWERRKSSRGHRSAVDGALEAHRQRKSEREARVQERLNMVRGMQTQFFPQSQAKTSVSEAVVSSQLQVAPVSVEQEVSTPNQIFNPRQIEALYDEAQMGSAADKALALVNKEISNPEEQPVEDVPQGSYVDYTV